MPITGGTRAASQRNELLRYDRAQERNSIEANTASPWAPRPASKNIARVDNGCSRGVRHAAPRQGKNRTFKRLLLRDEAGAAMEWQQRQDGLFLVSRPA